MRHESLAGGFLSAEPRGKHCATLGTPFNVTVIVLLSMACSFSMPLSALWIVTAPSPLPPLKPYISKPHNLKIASFAPSSYRLVPPANPLPYAHTSMYPKYSSVLLGPTVWTTFAGFHWLSHQVGRPWPITLISAPVRAFNLPPHPADPPNYSYSW